MYPKIDRQTAKVREMFTEDYDQPVLDYASGLRRQAMRAQEDAQRTTPFRDELLVIHLERKPAPTVTDSIHQYGVLPLSPSAQPPPPNPQPSSQPSPPRSGLANLSEALKRTPSKKSKVEIKKLISRPMPFNMKTGVGIPTHATGSFDPNTVGETRRRGVLIEAEARQNDMRQDSDHHSGPVSSSSSSSVMRSNGNLSDRENRYQSLHQNSGLKLGRTITPRARLRRRDIIVNHQPVGQISRADVSIPIRSPRYQLSEEDYEIDESIEYMMDAYL